MLGSPWQRTKHIASTYTITFIVVMLLNQILFFGLCLNPICLVAAMPHVLFLTALFGSFFNKIGNWGRNKDGDPYELAKSKQPKISKPVKPKLSDKIQNSLDAATTGLEGYRTRLRTFCILQSAENEYSSEKFFIQARLETAANQLDLKRRLDDDSDLAKIFEGVLREWGDEPKIEPAILIRKKVQVLVEPEGLDGEQDVEDIQKKIAIMATEHTQFLNGVKLRLDRDPDLMNFFEKLLIDDGGCDVLNYIKSIETDGGVPLISDGLRPQTLTDLNAIHPKRGVNGPSIVTTWKPLRNRGHDDVNHSVRSAKLKQRRPIFDVNFEVDEAPIVKRGDAVCSRDQIHALANKTGIPHLVHFTRCKNLLSILGNGLMSVEACDRAGVHAIRNDDLRLDGKLDGTSLSITFPNHRMFFKYRMQHPDEDWVVLLLSPSILWEKKCSFYKHNAADSRMRYLPASKMNTHVALQDMFNVVNIGREEYLRKYDTSDPQAEVMAHEVIEPCYIQTLAFETKCTANKWSRSVGGIDTIYAGQGKGLFSSRDKIRKSC